MSKRTLTNYHAFSFVEIFVALFIVSIVVLIASSLLETSLSLSKNTEARLARDSFRGILLWTFSHAKLCQIVLNSGANITVFDLAKAQSVTGLPLNITLDNGASIIASGDPAGVTPPIDLPKYNLAYEYVTFKNAVNSGPDKNIPGNTIYVGALSMKIDKMNNTTSVIGGTRFAEQTIGILSMSVSPANVISSCEAVNTIADACTNVGGVFAPNANAQCAVQSPCAVGKLFVGNDASGNPNCVDPQSACPAGDGLAPNAAGALVCTPI